ncbi:hypothetical protein [Dyella sp. 2HG41-7]|uniref:hypothetical protein n=1 Tax=Dyella sp. 2HG41-7 TaxID=2883239 RepID=UPI001F2888D8|nr:hypothetical protein [Dyella sp. 2HG41-7]
MDAHVPQRQGVVRLTSAEPLRRWPAWLLAIAWMVLLACVPWWIGLPLLLGVAAIQAAQLPRLQRFRGPLRRALRWGLAGLLIASYLAFDRPALGATLTLLGALVGFSLLVWLESWQDHKPQRDVAVAAAAPEWSEMALAHVGPSDTLIELAPPQWMTVDSASTNIACRIAMTAEHRCCIEATVHIDNIEPQVAVAPGEQWVALPMTAQRGLVLYDRAHDKLYRLRGWRLYGWHASEAWLSRSEEQPPLALSHVLGQDQIDVS